MMTPLLAHDNPGRFLGTMVWVLTDELGMPLKAGGSTTMRRKLKQRGIEADECFWIANAPRMAGRLRLNLRRDPPPDLAIEVEVTHGSIDRLPIYAALKVPEVWRAKDRKLTFHVLEGTRRYRVASASRIFPMVTPSDLERFLELALAAPDEHVVARQFRRWVRQRSKK